MKNNYITKIEIKNFYGWADTTVEFTDKVNLIEGATGTGKTTIGENSTRFVFGLPMSDKFKPTTGKNSALIPDLETKVMQYWSIDGVPYSFGRIGVQKWTTPKPTAENLNPKREYKGYEANNYLFNGLPTNETNFKERVSELFGIQYSELPYVLITGFFNKNVDWKDQRKYLFKKANVDSLTIELRKSPKYNLLPSYFAAFKNTDEIKKAITAEKNEILKLKAENDNFNKVKMADLVSLSAIDYKELEQTISKLDKQITALISSSNKVNKDSLIAEKAAELRALVQKKNAIEIKNSRLANEYNSKKNAAHRAASEMYAKIQIAENDVLSFKPTIIAAEMKLEHIKSEQFGENSTVCPNCKFEIQAAGYAEFEVTKAERIKNSEKSLLDAKAVLSNDELCLKSYKSQYAELKKQYDIINGNAFSADNAPLTALNEQITALETEISKMRMADVKTEVSDKLADLKNQLQIAQGQYEKRNTKKEVEEYIARLKTELDELSSKEAVCYQKLAQLEAYDFDEISLANDTVNAIFADKAEFGKIRFRLFDKKITGFDIACECEYAAPDNPDFYVAYGENNDGLSFGQRIQADLLVTKGLQKLLGVQFPIVKDNAGSDTLPFECDQQLIMLDTKKGKKLTGVTVKEAYRTIIEQMNNTKKGDK